jgi:hypothetical protein
MKHWVVQRIGTCLILNERIGTEVGEPARQKTHRNAEQLIGYLREQRQPVTVTRVATD